MSSTIETADNSTKDTSYLNTAFLYLALIAIGVLSYFVYQLNAQVKQLSPVVIVDQTSVTFKPEYTSEDYAAEVDKVTSYYANKGYIVFDQHGSLIAAPDYLVFQFEQQNKEGVSQ